MIFRIIVVLNQLSLTLSLEEREFLLFQRGGQEELE